MIHIVLNKNEILSMVEDYSSALGANRVTETGDSLFDVLRMTSDDSIVFNRFIYNAVKNITRKLLAWIISDKYTNEIVCLELNGFDKAGLVESEIKKYLNDYILGEWLLVKGNKEAEIYIGRATITLDNLPSLLHVRIYERKSNPF